MRDDNPALKPIVPDFFGRLHREWIGRPSVIVLSTAFVWLLIVLRLIGRLPKNLETTGDSAAYLHQESFRPPLYGWLLQGWQNLAGNLHWFADFQFLLMMTGLLLFAVQFGLLVRNSLIACLLLPLSLLHPGIYDAPRFMMTEAVYLALVLTGLAFQLRHVRRQGQISLVAASVCFALATLTRSTGAAFLPLPLLTGLFDSRLKPAGAVLHAGKAGLGIVLVVLTGMVWNVSRHGHFEIGSWSGLSLLQKSLPLLDASDVPLVPKAVAIVEPYAVAERKLVPLEPGLAARLRAHVQLTSSDLRWGILVPEAEQNWPQWKAADWRGRGLLGGMVSKQIIARHPLGYLRLWRNDFLALVLQPAYWPRWATDEIKDRNDYAACRLQQSCWALEIYQRSTIAETVQLVVSIIGELAALCLLAVFLRAVLRRTASPETLLFWSIAIVLQAGLLMSSAFEAGHIRMTVAFHILELAILAWLAMRATQFVLSARPGLPGQSAMSKRTP